MCCKIRIKQLSMFFYSVSLVTFFVFVLPLSVLPISKTSVNKITINGQVKESKGTLKYSEGLDIVLLKYILNNEGEVTPLGPQGRVKTKKNGKFEFVNIAQDLKAGFQLGTRVEGKLYSSKIFFMQDSEKFIEKNIIIPSLSNAVEKLETSQMSIVIEPRLGHVLVTEVIIFSNSFEERINTKSNPIKQKLPEELGNFRFLQNRSKNPIGYQIDGHVLKISDIFPTGKTKIIYQYNLPAWFGSLQMEREFNHPLDIVGIFTPNDRLQISSKETIFSGKKKFDKSTFLTWKIKNSDSNKVKLKISNVPQTSLQYSIVAIIILLLFFCIVLLFFRKRLLKQK